MRLSSSTARCSLAARGGRLIYGSNWPVTLRGTYGEYLSIVQAYVANKTRAAQEKFFYQNALQFYGLPPQALSRRNGRIRKVGHKIRVSRSAP